MSQVRVVLTAGYDKASNIVGLAELLRRDGITVAGIVVCSPFSWTRAKTLARQRGLGFFRDAAQRLLFGRPRGGRVLDPVETYLRSHGIVGRSLSSWAAANGTEIRSVKGLNSKLAIDFVKSCTPHFVLYGGGGILKEQFIQAAQGNVLNAHSGPLPFVRGMNACEWSILLGHAPAVTIHFIDVGIDTGPVVSVLPVPVLFGEKIETLRQRCLQVGIVGLREAVLTRPTRQLGRRNAPTHRQCFMMSPALRELAERKLQYRQLPPV